MILRRKRGRCSERGWAGVFCGRMETGKATNLYSIEEGVCFLQQRNTISHQLGALDRGKAGVVLSCLEHQTYYLTDDDGHVKKEADVSAQINKCESPTRSGSEAHCQAAKAKLHCPRNCVEQTGERRRK